MLPMVSLSEELLRIYVQELFNHISFSLGSVDTLLKAKLSSELSISTEGNSTDAKDDKKQKKKNNNNNNKGDGDGNEEDSSTKVSTSLYASSISVSRRLNAIFKTFFESVLSGKWIYPFCLSVR